MSPAVEPGDYLYGFCGGEFGDSYGIKVVVAVGRDWVVAREDNGTPVFARCSPADLWPYTTDVQYR